jgi:hypothetical protein
MLNVERSMFSSNRPFHPLQVFASCWKVQAAEALHEENKIRNPKVEIRSAQTTQSVWFGLRIADFELLSDFAASDFGFLSSLRRQPPIPLRLPVARQKFV